MRQLLGFTLIVVALWVVAPLNTTDARQDLPYTPQIGPPGTDIVVECDGRAFLVDDDFTVYADVFDDNNDGLIVLTVPNNIPTSNNSPIPYEVRCIPAGREFGNTLGDFLVTTCGLANAINQSTISIVPIQQLTGIAQFQGNDLGVATNGQFGRTLDITNAFNETLRIIVRGNNAAEVLTYLNSLSLDFKANPVVGNALNSGTCNRLVSSFNTRADTNVTGDIDVQFVLLQGGSITAGQQYIVSYTIDPEVRQDKIHTYQPIQTSAASARVTARAGGVNLTLWSDAGFLNAIKVSEDSPKLPALVNSVDPRETQYYAIVRGVDNFSNTYDIEGSFGTEPCVPGQGECGEVIMPDLELLQNGRGLSNGAVMMDGNFQVEGYCQGGHFDNFASYTDTQRNNEDWFCVNPSDGSIVALEQANFTEICQLTYNRQDAIAISDKGESIPAFNWRCFARG